MDRKLKEAETPPLYELRNVTKHFGAGGAMVTAVDEIDLLIERGEFAVVAGPSARGRRRCFSYSAPSTARAPATCCSRART